MGFVYGVLWILQALWIVLSETSDILKICPPPKKKIQDAPDHRRKIYECSLNLIVSA